MPAPLVAAIWTRDGKKWELQADLALGDLPKSGELAEKEGLVPFDVVALPATDATAERRFALLWSEPAQEGEQRRLLVDFGETVLETMEGQLVKQGFIAQTTISVWTDAAGQRRYAGIWSNQGAPSESNPAYAGFELVDQPQWDVAVAPAETVKLADPLAAFREQLAAIEKLPAEKQDDPKIRQVRATAHYQLAHLEPALADIDFLLGKELATPFILQLHPLVLARLGKAEQAQSALTKYLATSAPDSHKSSVRIQVPAWLGELEQASQQLELAVTAHAQNVDDLYNVACAAALSSQAVRAKDAAQADKFADRTFDLLRQCVGQGYRNAENLKAAHHFASLHTDPRFTALVEKLEPPARYAAVWRADVEFESKLLSAVPLDKSLADLQSLLALGYRPFAIAIDSAHASSSRRPGTPQ